MSMSLTSDPSVGAEGGSEELASAVRALAVDVHRLLTRIAVGGPGHYEGTLATLQQRAYDLMGRVGEGPAEGLRWWLESLRRRVSALQWLSEFDSRRAG